VQGVPEHSPVEPAREEAPPEEAASTELAAHAVDLEQVADAWQRSIVEAVRERSIPVASLLAEARPAALEDDTLTLEFPVGADFHRLRASEPGNIGVLRDALYEVTGRRLTVVLETGEADDPGPADDEPLSEEDVISLLKETLDAEEVEPDR
jgi:hypothetical protein